MIKETAQKGFWGLMETNPRAAFTVGSAIIIMVLGGVISKLWIQNNNLVYKMLEQEISCNKGKFEMVNNYINRQQEQNDRYAKKIEDLYERIEAIKHKTK